MRFTFIDALRAIAALSVVLFHALEGEHIPLLYQAMPARLQAVLAHSDAGVAIFFVISGFVISHSLGGRDLALSDVGRFMLRRSIRLDPAYWVTIAIACVIAVSKGLLMFSAGQIAAHLVYAQDLLGMPPISPIFWTLCLELQFYLIFALILLARSRWLLVGAFTLSLPLSCMPIWHGLFTELWYGFLLGVGAYQRRPFFLLYALCIAALAIIRHDIFMEVCALTSLAVRYGDMRWLNWRWIQFIGGISYSLYLIHNSVTGVTFRMMRFVGDGVAAECAALVLSIAFSVLTAWLMWFLIERPSIRLSRMVRLGAAEGEYMKVRARHLRPGMMIRLTPSRMGKVSSIAIMNGSCGYPFELTGNDDLPTACPLQVTFSDQPDVLKIHPATLLQVRQPVLARLVDYFRRVQFQLNSP